MENEESGWQHKIPTEMLDLILSFTDNETLTAVRQVCRKWRATSDLTIQRRVRVHRTGRTCWLSLRKKGEQYVNKPFKEPDSSGEPEAATLNELESAERVSISVSRISERRRMPPGISVLSNVLQLHWVSMIQRLALSWLTLLEWNAVGFKLLNKMPGLLKLDLTLITQSSNVLPLCLSELKENAEDTTFDALHTVSIAVVETLCNESKEDDGSTIVCYDLLNRCPNLKVLTVRVKGYFSTESDGGNFKCYLRNPLEKTKRSVRDIAALVKMIKPNQLEIPLHSDLIAAIEPCAELQKLKLITEAQNYDTWEDSMEALATSTAFHSVVTVEWTFDLQATFRTTCKHLRNGSTALPNVKTFVLQFPDCSIFKSKNDYASPIRDVWLVKNLQKLLPNVELLFAPYVHSDGGTAITSRSGILQLASSFNKLKHLIVMDDNYFQPKSVYLTNSEKLGLRGLESVTVLVHLPHFLVDSAKIYLKACSLFQTIKNLGIFWFYETTPGDFLFVNINPSIDPVSHGLKVPEHLEFKNGPFADVVHNSAFFKGEKQLLNGVDIRMIIWEWRKDLFFGHQNRRILTWSDHAEGEDEDQTDDDDDLSVDDDSED